MRRTADAPDGDSIAASRLLNRNEPAKAAVERIRRVMARVTTMQGSIRMAAQSSVMSQFYHK